MKAVILAAGLGKRMRPLTNDKPKALVEFKDKPLLEHVLQSFEKAGVKEAIIIVNFDCGKIEKRFGNSFGKIKLKYVKQRVAMGTAHAVLQVKGKIKGKFLVGSADVIVLPSLWKKLMQEKGKNVIVALRKEKHPERFGVALISGKKLEAIVEKPTGKIESNLVNSGCYMFSQKIFPALEETKISKRSEFEITDSINSLAAKGKAGFIVYSGKCIDIGTVEELKKAEEEG